MDLEFIHQEYMPDSLLVSLYDNARVQGLAGKVFTDDSFIKSSSDWVAYVRSRCWLVLITEGDPLEPFAVFWLDSFIGKVAMFHYWCYRRAWGKLTDEFFGQVFTWLKENIDGQVRHLIGYTPESNRLAVRVLKRAGFEIKFTLPGAGGYDETMIVSHKEL